MTGKYAKYGDETLVDPFVAEGVSDHAYMLTRSKLNIYIFSLVVGTRDGVLDVRTVPSTLSARVSLCPADLLRLKTSYHLKIVSGQTGRVKRRVVRCKYWQGLPIHEVCINFRW